MSTYYVRSTTGSDSNNGTTWALAKATLAAAVAIATSGDTIWVSQVHAESGSAGITISSGVLSLPLRILCGNDAAQPPTSLATTATVTSTAGNISFTGSQYHYGITYIEGGTTSSTMLLCEASTVRQQFDNCGFWLTTTGGSALISIGGSSGFNGNQCILNNPTFKFGAASQVIAARGNFIINGGSIASGSTSLTNLFGGYASNRGVLGVVNGMDLTNMATTTNLALGGATACMGLLQFRGVLLPGSWSGSLVSATISNSGFRIEMWDTDNAATNYRTWIEECFINPLKTETTIVRTGGSNDGTTGWSWKTTTPSVCAYPSSYAISPPLEVWNNTTGSSVTATIEIERDSATNLKDNEIWGRFYYMGNSGNPQYTMIEDVTASVVATPADQDTSSATWTTTGQSNPNKQKLVCTFTPQQKGPIIGYVICAKPSITYYTDGMITLS